MCCTEKVSKKVCCKTVPIVMYVYDSVPIAIDKMYNYTKLMTKYYIFYLSKNILCLHIIFTHMLHINIIGLFLPILTTYELLI